MHSAGRPAAGRYSRGGWAALPGDMGRNVSLVASVVWAWSAQTGTVLPRVYALTGVPPTDYQLEL